MSVLKPGDRPINIVVVGCGYWGPNLIRSFSQTPGANLYAICDLDLERLESFRSQYPSVRLETSLSVLLADEAVDGVVIATAAPSHFRLVSQAMLAGKHVFVEKPMTLKSADAMNLARASEECSRILMVGHLLEYHPAIDFIKSYVDAGKLGEIRYIYSQRLNLGKVRSDENALWSLAPHDISVAGYLLQDTPLDVSAVGQSYLRSGVEDLAFATLRYADGRLAHIHVSWLDPHKIRKVTIVGTRKMVVFDDMEPSEKIRIYDKGVDREFAEFVTDEQSLKLRDGDIIIPRIDLAEPLRRECAAFIQAIRTGIPPRSNAWDGVRVVRILEAADRSLQQGGERVPLTEAEREVIPPESPK